MMNVRLPALAVAAALAATLVGCAEKGEDQASAPSSAAPAASAKAFWKKDATPATAASALAVSHVSTARPGWAALPPIEKALVKQGKSLLDTKGCTACHGFGKKSVGPDLNGITARVEPAWLEKWIANPEPMLESDPYAKELLAKYLVKMPNQQVKRDQIKAIIAYLRQNDKQMAEKAAHKDKHKDREQS